MSSFRLIFLVAMLMQFCFLSSARTRFTPDRWFFSLNEFNPADDFQGNAELFDASIPENVRIKKAFRTGFHFGNEDRTKKFLGESNNFQNAHSLQGLWAMPGRR